MALVVILQNVSHLAPVSDYRYTVLVGDGTDTGSVTIEEGEVREHTRTDGWTVLVSKLLSQRIKTNGKDS